MRECENNSCDDAAAKLLSSIDGDSGIFGCDLLTMMKDGDASGRWLAGYEDFVATRGAYILALANNGIIAHSTYFTIKENSKDAWKIIQ